MTAGAIYDELDRRAAEVADQVITWRHHLHQPPELSNRESNTAALIADHLRSLNPDEVRTGIAGHGIVGVLRGGMGGDRTIALRAVIDALRAPDLCGVDFASKVADNDYPGGLFPVSHACGHDCHTAMLMGAASGGRGMTMNHNPHCCADDGPLVTGVRLHAHVTDDHRPARAEMTWGTM